MSGVLRGRSALVTGAGRGIGRATALELARRGVNVIVVARTAAELAVTAGMAREFGVSAFALQADLGSPDQVATLAARARAELGSPEILINNAAMVAPLGPSLEIDRGAWANSIGLNVISVAALTFSMLPDMLERGWGRVMNVSSGVVAYPAGMIGGNAYVTSKAALEAHTVNLAAELAETGVTVNAFRPGAVDTAMQEWIRSREPTVIGERLHARFQKSFEDGELITPERSAAVLIAHLETEVSGELLDVSGPPAGMSGQA